VYAGAAQMLVNSLKPKDIKQFAHKGGTHIVQSRNHSQTNKRALRRTHTHACHFSSSTHYEKMAKDAMGEKAA